MEGDDLEVDLRLDDGLGESVKTKTEDLYGNLVMKTTLC